MCLGLDVEQRPALCHRGRRRGRHWISLDSA